MFRKATKINWASDSLFKEHNEDSTFKATDSLKADSLKTISQHEKAISEKNKLTVKEKGDSSKNIKTKKEPSKEEVIAFEEPKAIHLEQAYSLYNKGIMFIDARDESDYLAGHIKNSINIPFEDFDNHKQILEKLSKDKPVVTYCAGTECDLSILLGNLLFKDGYKQVYVFFGGWLEWTNAKYPIEKSNTEKSDE